MVSMIIYESDSKCAISLLGQSVILQSAENIKSVMMDNFNR